MTSLQAGRTMRRDNLRPGTDGALLTSNLKRHRLLLTALFLSGCLIQIPGGSPARAQQNDLPAARAENGAAGSAAQSDMPDAGTPIQLFSNGIRSPGRMPSSQQPDGQQNAVQAPARSSPVGLHPPVNSGSSGRMNDAVLRAGGLDPDKARRDKAINDSWEAELRQQLRDRENAGQNADGQQEAGQIAPGTVDGPTPPPGALPGLRSPAPVAQNNSGYVPTTAASTASPAERQIQAGSSNALPPSPSALAQPAPGQPGFDPRLHQRDKGIPPLRSTGTGDTMSEARKAASKGMQIDRSSASTKQVEKDGMKFDGVFWDSDRRFKGRITYSDGGIYEGEALDGQRHGYGEMQYPNGGRHVGSWKNDVWHGKGTAYVSNGNVYEGDYVDGLKEGQGTYRWADGSSYTGGFAGGAFSGQGTRIWPNGDRYTGRWKNGRRDGPGRMEWQEKGWVYDGSWVNDMRHGQGNIDYGDGDSYSGGWAQDKRHGQGTYRWASGDIYQGEWTNGQRQGQGRFTFANGDVYEGEWQLDRQHGKGVLIRRNGSKVEGTWYMGNRRSASTSNNNRSVTGR